MTHDARERAQHGRPRAVIVAPTRPGASTSPPPRRARSGGPVGAAGRPGAAAAAAAQHRPDRAGAGSRASSCSSRGSIVALLSSVGAAVDRPGRRGDPAGDRRAADRLAHALRPGRRPHGHRVDDVRRRRRLLVATVVFRRWRHLFTFLGERDRPADRRHPADRGLRSGPGPTTSPPSVAGRATRCRRRPPPIVSFTVVGIVYMLVVPGRPRRIAKVVGTAVVALVVGGPAVPRRRPPLRRPRRRRPRRGDPAQRLPLLHAQRGRSRDVPAGQDRPPRRRRPARRGDPARRRGPARRHRARREAGRPGRIRRLDAAAHAPRRRPRHVRVREALRDEPRAGGPLVQARAARSCTGGSRTRRRSSRCAGSSSTRTTRCG